MPQTRGSFPFQTRFAMFDVISCETFRQETLPQPWSDLIKIFLPIFFYMEVCPNLQNRSSRTNPSNPRDK